MFRCPYLASGPPSGSLRYAASRPPYYRPVPHAGSWLELAERSVHLLCFFQTTVALIPIDVLHECVNVHCGIRPVIHVIGMLKHVVHQDWPAKRYVVRVVECNVIVKLAVTEVEVQNSPATAAAE